MWPGFTFSIALHLIKPSGKSSNSRRFLFHKEVEGWDGPGQGGKPGWVRGWVTVGLSKGTGVEVCFVERSLFSCRCVHRRSPHVRLVAYCPPSQEPPWTIRTATRRQHTDLSAHMNMMVVRRRPHGHKNVEGFSMMTFTSFCISLCPLCISLRSFWLLAVNLPHSMSLWQFSLYSCFVPWWSFWVSVVVFV